jgi:hypothetical protein
MISDPTGKHCPYFGKGTNNRYNWHWKEFKKKGFHQDNYKLTKMFKHLERQGLEPKYKQIFQTNSEQAAYQCEEFCTRYYGLENLSNLQHGGFGTYDVSEETRLKMSKTRRGRKHTWGNKIAKARKGFKFSEESKKKMSRSHTGKKLSEEHKKKMSKLTTGSKNPFSKLNEEQAKYIKANPDSLSPGELARKMNVCYHTIYDIRRGNRWKHV